MGTLGTMGTVGSGPVVVGTLGTMGTVGSGPVDTMGRSLLSESWTIGGHWGPLVLQNYWTVWAFHGTGTYASDSTSLYQKSVVTQTLITQ